MKVSKKKASELWCPMARMDGSENSYNIWIQNENKGFVRCIADRCMMWIWETDEEIRGSCGVSGDDL